RRSRTLPRNADFCRIRERATKPNCHRYQQFSKLSSHHKYQHGDAIFADQYLPTDTHCGSNMPDYGDMEPDSDRNIEWHLAGRVYRIWLAANDPALWHSSELGAVLSHDNAVRFPISEDE